MKTNDVSDYGDQSCSCTSCVYRTESDRPSLRRIISLGSRIDRLYYGKYIPLRERKLLEKLVRTRGVYDNIKAQLLSSSTISLDTKSGYKPRRKLSLKKFNDRPHSDAILELVDLVDRGEKLESKELSGCCSCCSCSSKLNLHYKSTDKRRTKRAHLGGYRQIHTREKIGGHRKRGVRFKTKHIKSDPCTCTFKFSGMLKKISNAKLKKIHAYHPTTLVDFMPTTDEEINQKHKITNLLRSSIEKLQNSKTQIKNIMTEGVKKVTESKTKIQEKVILHTKTSLEKLNKVKNSIKTKIKDKKRTRDVPKNNNMLACECPENDLVSQIRKDSISKFKGDLKRKDILKDWECDFDCIEDTCFPEECYYKLKQSRLRRLKPKYDKDIKGSVIMQDRINQEPLHNPSIKIQSKQRTFVPAVVDEQKPILQTQQSSKERKKTKKVQKDIKQADKKKIKFICKCSKSKNKTQNVKSGTVVPAKTVIKDRTKNLNISPPRKKGIHISPKPKIENIRPESRQQVVRIGSSFTFNIEFYKNKAEPSQNPSQISFKRLPKYSAQSPIKNIDRKLVKNVKNKTVKKRQRGSQIKLEYTKKNTKTGEDNSKRCLCPVKFKYKRNKIKTDTLTNKDDVTVEKSSMTFSSGSVPCTPLDCIINPKCNLIECKIKNQNLNNVETNTYYTTYPNTLKITKRGKKKLKNKKQLLLPYECEPGVCTPHACNPHECIKLISARKAKSKHRSVQCECIPKISYSGRNKSTSSLNTRKSKHSSTKPKFVKSLITHTRDSVKSGKLKNKLKKIKHIRTKHINNANTYRNGHQLVRIGSTFSFNLEFHKTKSPETVSPIKFKKASIETHPSSYEETSHHKSVEITPLNNNLHKKTGIGTTLKRCFCTLKLQDKKNIKTKKKKIHTTGMDFVDNIHSNVVTYNKSTKTKISRPLQAFECEPFVCVPGACDPYECLERINKRYKYLKEIGSITDHPVNRSVSSTTYSKKSLKTVDVQSNKPYSKNRKTLAKPNIISRKLKRYTSSGKANQAVKIGSSFTFNIEFNKTKTPIQEVNSKLQMKPTIHKHSIKEKKKEKNINKLNVANVTTQVKGEKKIPKASMADHFVKRCFCTLNLQKYRKRQPVIPREYIINTAMTELNPYLTCENSNGCKITSKGKLGFIHDINHNINRQPKYKFPSLNHAQSINFQRSSSIVEKMSQSCSLNTLDVDRWTSSFRFIEDNVMFLKHTETTNLNQYVRQCFCTMNLQLVNKTIPNKKPKNALPFSTIKYPKNPFKSNKEPPKSDKSSVRVGSSFSFNIDFSKNVSSTKNKKYVDDLFLSKYSSETELDKLEKTKSKKLKHIGTKKNNITYNEASQSAIDKLAHKASITAPIMRRCFCTLKLQKKGRLYKKLQATKNNKNLLTNTIIPSLSKASTVNKAQNTAFKPLNLAQSLKPYECEPNICIPGYCDPYQCLEIMKRRQFNKHTKESGIGTKQTKKSVSILTIGNISKGTQKRYRAKIRPNQEQVKIRKKNIESDIFKPSRQVVRVGSNFSFNIEFFKDLSSPASTELQTKSKDLKERLKIKNLHENKKRKRYQNASQVSKLVREKDTEIKKFPRTASTMTTTQRCFCIAQLKGLNNKSVDLPLEDKPTFLKKCFCLFKSIKTFTSKNERIRLDKVPHYDKKTNTQNITKLDEYQRYPYECEPGICIPGECNPYECYKILKRSNNKAKSASTGPEKKTTRSIYSNSNKLLTKNAKTQLKNKNKTRDFERKSFSQPYFKDADRNVVKIGSNFSFNIEFYKDKLPKYDRNMLLQQLQIKSKETNSNEKNKNIITTKMATTRSQRSQIDLIRKTDHSTENNQSLKRCFCTLQLDNKYANKTKLQLKEKKKNQGIKLSTKSVMTKREKHNLNMPKFYECDSDICVPYQCDPYECEKIMKIRRKQQDFKEVGSLTQIPKKFAASSVTKPLKKSKRDTQTKIIKNNMKNAYYKDNKESRPMQKVKIGSSFEFNIEFSKNKNDFGLEMNKQPKPLDKKSIRQTNAKKHKQRKRKHKQVKFDGTKSTRSHSTLTNVKRNKTSFFKKPKPEKHLNLQNTTSTIGTLTPKHLAHATLLPYECEPQTCIPGECNPIECLERIKKRNKNFGGTTNFLHKTNTVSTMTAGKAKLKTRKNQFKSLNKDESRTKKETSRNLTRQAVRIGSNFNFNIEFYKGTAGPYTVSKKVNNIKKIQGDHKTSQFKIKQMGTPPLKTKSKVTAPDKSILKRCFCLLKLQKQTCVVSNCPEFKTQSLQTYKQKNEYKAKHHNSINDKITATTKPNFLKRCLCVFKIRKINRHKNTNLQLNSNIIKHQVPQHRLNQTMVTQEELLPYECEPNVCVPGKCDPYECEKRIRKRILRKELKDGSNISKLSATDNVRSRSIKVQGPTMNKQQHKQTLYSHTNKNVSNSTERDGNKNAVVKFTKQSLQDRKTVIDKPKNTNLNKQVVKIGSNISFNIEFYKQTKPKLKLNTLDNSQKLLDDNKNIPINSPSISNVYDKNISTKSAFIRNRGSQGKVIKTEDKTLEVQTKPNRCFCTMKLQKNVHPKYREKNLNSFRKSPHPQYPQTFEIRALTVQQKYKKPPKKTHSTVRSVATRINNKYIKENKNSNSLRNTCPCTYRIINSSEMETILPYTPTKFKKTSSKTLLPSQNKYLIKNKIKASNKISRGKKLNKKRSERNINGNRRLLNKNELKEKSTPFKGFFCRCAALFTKKPKNSNLMNTMNSNIENNDIINHEIHDGKKLKKTCNICDENLRSSKSDRKPMQQLVDQNRNIKKSKSLKIDDKCDIKCDKYPTVTLRVDQKRNRKNYTMKEITNHQQVSNLKSAGAISGEEIRSGVQARSIKRKQRNYGLICTHCQKDEKLRQDKGFSSHLKVHFADVKPNANFLNEPKNFKNRLKADKPFQRDRNNKEYYEYCSSCGKKINKVELQNAAGDHLINENNKSPKHPNKKIKDLFKLNRNTDNVCSGEYKEKPLFEMQLNRDDYDIINKTEVIDIVTKLSKKGIKDEKKKSHKKSCRCCFCLNKQNKTGAHIHVAPKGSKICRTLGKLLDGSKANKPCTCGSYICSKKNQKIKTGSHKIKGNKTYWKPCECGSPICDRESATMRDITLNPDKIKCICRKENEKIEKKIKAKQRLQESKHRKKQNKEDLIRRKRRLKEDKEMEKRINKNASDLVLAAESAIDIGKLGITACADILRAVARSASDPKQAYNTLKAMKENPRLIQRHLKSAYDDSGVAATARRVRLRCLAMRGVKKLKNTLESYAITNFLLHIADKDPKRRLPKPRKPERVRERLDFGCSLYMASLRKRPFLSIYDRCPWFYPHFLSLVNVWKQFMDIMLFLLAVAVWSPCILCMEVCRAMMCCFFCTG